MTAASTSLFSAEIRLTLLLCRFPLVEVESSDLHSAVALACSLITDWDHFLRLVKHHRVTSLVLTNAQTLAASLPGAVYAELRARSASNAIESFRYLAEVQRLLKLFDEAGIEASVFKGVALSLQAYGDVSKRDVGDIDLLVAPEHARKADMLLREGTGDGRTFRRIDPSGLLTPRRYDAYVNSFKDFTYQPEWTSGDGEQACFEVDLHWRLFRNPYMPGNSLAEQPRAVASAGSIQLRTFSPRVNLLYLSVHGAVDGWSRLKAVADVAALWKTSSHTDKEAATDLARETGVLPYLQAALLLASQWIGGLDLPNLPMSREQARLSRAVTGKARATMEGNGFLPPLREPSSWKMKRDEASLHASTRYHGAIMRRMWYRPRVWSRFNLPDTCFHLYPLLSPVEWLLFRLDRSWHRKDPS